MKRNHIHFVPVDLTLGRHRDKRFIGSRAECDVVIWVPEGSLTGFFDQAPGSPGSIFGPSREHTGGQVGGRSGDQVGGTPGAKSAAKSGAHRGPSRGHIGVPTQCAS